MTRRERDGVDEADAESFPASDPPSWSLGASRSGETGVREVVGVFPDAGSFGRAIDALQSAGLDRARLSVLAGGEEAEAQLRAANFRRVDDLLDSDEAPRASLTEPESIGLAQGALVAGLFYVGAGLGAAAIGASGGALAPVVAGALAGGSAGGGFGAFLAHRLGVGRARYAEAQLAHGGLVLWARVVSHGEEARVIALMREHGGHEVHAHGAPDSRTDTGA